MTRIFGIGLSRTGSKSLTKALTILGYRAIHFPTDPVTRSEYSQFFDHPSNLLRLNVLDQYDAVLDNPISRVYRQLDQAYPGSKFILTIRDKQSWLRSCELWWDRFVDPMIANDPEYGPFMSLVGKVTYGTQHFDKDLFSESFDSHLTEVTDYFRGRRRDLLVLNICAGDGWQKLAPFTGNTVPYAPFPHLNKMISKTVPNNIRH
jgi:hypothetical protein